MKAQKIPPREEILAKFTPSEITPKYRVKVNGVFVTLNGHNKVYTTIGATKNALQAHLRRVYLDADTDEEYDGWRAYVMAEWVGQGPDFPIRIVQV